MARVELSNSAAAHASTLDMRGRRARFRSAGIAVPALILACIVFACFVWPVYSVQPPVGGSVLESNQPLFSPNHFLGTDLNGNDTWSRLLHGGRVSLQVAVLANLIGLVVGGLLGSVSGYLGGKVDTVVMRALDVLIAFPSLVLVLTIAHGLGPGLLSTVCALSAFSVPAFSRIARAATLRLRGWPFMLAAKLCGTSHPRVLFCHVAPNVLPQLVTFGLLGIGLAITIEGALSYLGLGVPAPNPSWGNMIFHGQQILLASPVLVLLPSAALFVTVLSFNLVGEALRARWANEF
jgi:peptide/nickel transport system permease protein